MGNNQPSCPEFDQWRKQNDRRARVQILATVEGLVVAGLLAWSTLLWSTVQSYAEPCGNTVIWHVYFMLGVVYWAVLVSLISIALAAFSMICPASGQTDQTAPGAWRTALGLAIYSGVLVAVVVFLSMISVLAKAAGGTDCIGPIWVWSSSHSLTGCVAGLFVLVCIIVPLVCLCRREKRVMCGFLCWLAGRLNVLWWCQEVICKSIRRSAKQQKRGCCRRDHRDEQQK